MFHRARVVIGYHGAGLVNAAFSIDPVAPTCVIEITTHKDVNATQPWRYNCPMIRRWNHQVICHRYNLPIQQIMSPSQFREEGYLTNPDHYIKRLGNIPLTSTDVSRIGDIVESCHQLTTIPAQGS